MKTTEELQAELTAMRQENLEKCRVAVNDVLEQYHCTLAGYPSYVPAGDGTFAMIVQVGIEPRA